MDRLRVALGFFPYARWRHWPGLAFYFLGWALFRATGLRLFHERLLRLKPFTVCADIEGQSGLVFLYEILVQGIYDPADFPSPDRVRLIFDAGANCGFYALAQAARHPTVRIVCFEPHPATFQRLQRNVAVNHLESRVTPCHAAVAATSGQCALRISPESSMGIVSTSSAQFLEKPTEVDVDMVSMDDYAARTQAYPEVLKIDVEGFEVEVLKGATRCLERAIAVVMEVHSEPLARDCIALLTAAHFQVVRRGDLVFARK